jgi:hypothetical protein
MKKHTLSLLLAGLLAVSGAAMAQTNDAKSGTQGGAGPTGKSGVDNSASTKSRAEVKSDINTTPNKAGINAGEGASPQTNPNTSAPMAATSAERKMQRKDNAAARKARLKSKDNVDKNKSGMSAN